MDLQRRWSAPVCILRRTPVLAMGSRQAVAAGRACPLGPRVRRSCLGDPKDVDPGPRGLFPSGRCAQQRTSVCRTRGPTGDDCILLGDQAFDGHREIGKGRVQPSNDLLDARPVRCKTRQGWITDVAGSEQLVNHCLMSGVEDRLIIAPNGAHQPPACGATNRCWPSATASPLHRWPDATDGTSTLPRDATQARDTSERGAVIGRLQALISPRELGLLEIFITGIDSECRPERNTEQ